VTIAKVKREGRVSSLLHDTYAAGSSLQVSGPMGRFTFNDEDADEIVMIAGGVGLTPLMSKLRYLRDKRWPGRIDLVYSARSGREVIFEE
jgi:glycine betaine catabolism B